MWRYIFLSKEPAPICVFKDLEKPGQHFKQLIHDESIVD